VGALAATKCLRTCRDDAGHIESKLFVKMVVGAGRRRTSRPPYSGFDPAVATFRRPRSPGPTERLPDELFFISASRDKPCCSSSACVFSSCPKHQQNHCRGACWSAPWFDYSCVCYNENEPASWITWTQCVDPRPAYPHDHVDE